MTKNVKDIIEFAKKHDLSLEAVVWHAFSLGVEEGIALTKPLKKSEHGDWVVI